MKKLVLLSSVAASILFITFSFLNYQKRSTVPVNLDPERDGLIYDEKTATKIAEVVWLAIYGGEIYTHKPFTAELQDSVWVVNGTVHTTLGGAPYMKIRQKDGKILDVTHYK